MLRAEEKGWVRVSPLDDPGRRAVWIRISEGKVEMCAGREGDDAYVELKLDGTSTERDLYNLLEVAQTGIYSFDETNRKPDDGSQI